MDYVQKLNVIFLVVIVTVGEKCQISYLQEAVKSVNKVFCRILYLIHIYVVCVLISDN